MAVLSPRFRKTLENAIREARIVAEEAAADAIKRLGIAAPEAPIHLSDEQKVLRRRLRAHARSLGDTRDAKGEMTTVRLGEAAGYELWHRMLFGRFLMERNLLLHPEFGVPISMAEAQEIAAEDKDHFPDEWAVAEHFAAPTLPMVFKPDDPVLALQFDPYFHARLRALLVGLRREVFEADDSLGWTYQFWRADEKEAVYQSGVKVGAAELPAVTQLFTEPYMVKFLLHNTLGAWWAGKVLAAKPSLAVEAVDEQALRDACSLPGIAWEYLRFVRDDEAKGSWRPAAGTFPGWPDHASDITFCDPCCGSGHFLVEAFTILAALRQAEEELSPEAAALAVLRDNLHGLEIDGRCVQIAAFNVALAAWRLAGGPITLPLPHIAWVGAPPPMSRTEMAALANGDTVLGHSLEVLYDQFAQAPLLGTLLEIGVKDLLDADVRERGVEALARLRGSEPERAEGAIAARGLLDAVALLTLHYVLQATNVPFLGRGKQVSALASFVERNTPSAKTDLATTMLERMRRLSQKGGSLACVTPQTWLYLKAYKDFRRAMISDSALEVVVDLGPAAFQDMNWWASRTALIVLRIDKPKTTAAYSAMNADTGRDLNQKPNVLRIGPLLALPQRAQLANPEARILTSKSIVGPPLARLAISLQGIKTGDDAAFRRTFWEIDSSNPNWKRLQSTVERSTPFGGLTDVVWWRNPEKSLARLQGLRAHGRVGCAVSQMGGLPCSLFLGDAFDSNISAIIPENPAHVPAIFAFLSSPEYSKSVRQLEPGTKANNAILAQIPFDLAHWEEIASEQYPEGLPDPYSDDPTQWLFHGHPAFARSGSELHVTLARLGGYRWPGETDGSMRLAASARERLLAVSLLPDADADGLLPLHITTAAKPLADRLREVLAIAYGAQWTNEKEQDLVRAADLLLDKREARAADLETWLRDRAFRQHCVLFLHRPFVWHIWDGLPDGFSVFAHYHRLDRATLEKLTYSLLGDWIARAKAEGRTAREERAEQLRQRLTAILEGEPPYDIFVRWKPLARQPIGWEPDLDDGVRLNIRPFVEAEVLRETPKGIHWNKDRGADLPSAPWFDLGPRYGGKSSDRINDHHLTLVEKHAARERLRL